MNGQSELTSLHPNRLCSVDFAKALHVQEIINKLASTILPVIIVNRESHQSSRPGTLHQFRHQLFQSKCDTVTEGDKMESAEMKFGVDIRGRPNDIKISYM